MNQDLMQAMLEKNRQPSYGLTLVLGFPFSDSISDPVETIQRRIEELAPGCFAWYQRTQLHATIVAYVRGRYRETPALQRSELPANLAGFLGDLQSVCTSIQPFLFRLTQVKITEEGMVIATGDAPLNKSAFVFSLYPELDQPKHAVGWAVTLGYLQAPVSFASEHENKRFAAHIARLSGPTIGQAFIRQVWLVHYANRTMNHIVGRLSFPLGTSTAPITPHQLLKKLSLG